MVSSLVLLPQAVKLNKQNKQIISDHQKCHSIRNKSNHAIKYNNLFINNNNSALDHKNYKSEKELMGHKKENSYEINNSHSLLNNNNIPMSERANKKIPSMKKMKKKEKIKKIMILKC